MRFDEKPKVVNHVPSRAYRNKQGEYVPCPDNQPAAFREFQERKKTKKGKP